MRRGWAPRWWEAEVWPTFLAHMKLLRVESREERETEEEGRYKTGWGQPPPPEILARLPYSQN